mgnify:CR=1 FL=1
MNRSKRLSVSMTRRELLWGFGYFLFYLMVLPSVLEILFSLLSWDYNSTRGHLRLTVLFNGTNFLAMLLIFHRFLGKSLAAIKKRFWGFVQAVILGWVLYQAATSLVMLLCRFIMPELQNLNNAYFADQARENYTVTAIATVFLAPPVEECLFRGLLFRTIHQKSRFLAFAISALAFALVHITSYLSYYGPLGSALLLLQYLPAGLALGWAYEKADTIFAPMVIHMVINAISMGRIL